MINIKDRDQRLYEFTFSEMWMREDNMTPFPDKIMFIEE